MKLLWLDLETSGLDPRRDDVLELAYAVSDLERPFEIAQVGGLHVGSFLLRYRWAHQTWDPRVREMHTKNGLIADLERNGMNCRYLAEAERKILKHVPEVEDYNERPVIAGASVGPFDLQFIRNVMPTLAARLSHRAYDVSAIKLFCRSLGMSQLPRGEAHRAAADVLEAVAHAKACAEWLVENGLRASLVFPPV
jgi:oligoribonuclease